MLNQENAQLLETKVLERIDNLTPDDNLKKLFSQIAVQATIITLQEYEKLFPNKEI